MRRPLFFPFIGLIAGIIVGNYFDFPYSLLLIGLIFLLIAMLLSLRGQCLVTGFILIFGLALIIGIFNIQKQQYLTQTDDHITKHVDSGKKTVEGIVVESPLAYLDKNVLIIRCLRIMENETYIPVTGNVRLVIPVDLTYSYGDFVRFHSLLKKIQSFKNPGSFDYETYLHRQGVYATGFIANSSGIVLLRENSASHLKLLLESFRTYLKTIIYKNAPSPQREIIEAMIIGNQNSIPAFIRDNFNKTGTSHILSISGLHIGMVAATAFFLIAVFLKTSEYLMLRLNIIKVSALAAFILVIIYSLVAGMGVTVIRSALMALVFLIALILDKQTDLYNTLALAGLIILVINPEALFDISFQLSFLAVLALIYIVPRFTKPSFLQNLLLPAWGQSIIRYLYMSILVCLAATIGTLPLIIYYFNRVSAITIIANLITVPLLGTLTLAIAMAFLLTAFFSTTLAGFFIQLTSYFVGISIEIINKLASLSWSSFSFARPNIMEIIIFYLFFIFLLQFIDARRGRQNIKGFFAQHPFILKYALISLVVFSIGNGLYLSLKDRFSADLKITAIDVGQGSSILVRFPAGENMLIDGGGFADSSFDMGRMVIAPYLYQERISKIQTVVLTHPHPDHMLGLFYILDNFNVQEFWSTGLMEDEENHQKRQKLFMERKIKTAFQTNIVSVKKIGNIEINFFWPPPLSGIDAKELSADDINDTSLVFRIKYGNVSFLVTGDISANIESLLVRSGKDFQSDVLFVPHHGSIHSSSTEFIKKAACRYAVISAGKGNAFHHPHPLILQRYNDAQVQVLRTDQDGAVTFTTDGISLTKDTVVKSK